MNKFRHQKGFTLIELITSMFIFSILAIMISSVFISSLNMERRAFNIQQIVENVNFIFEAMAKEIRVANLAPQDTDSECLIPAATLNFVNASGENIVYSLVNGNIHRSVNGVDSVLSSNTVEFTRFQFCIRGSTVGDNTQPRITVLAAVRTREASQQEIIDIQTTLSQRYLSD